MMAREAKPWQRAIQEIVPLVVVGILGALIYLWAIQPIGNSILRAFLIGLMIGVGPGVVRRWQAAQGRRSG